MTERLSARRLLSLLTDDFAELPPPGRQTAPDGPLAWPGYGASRARAAGRTGESESVVCGTGRIEGTPAVLIAFEFGFLGGSLGQATGDRLEAAYAHARAHRLPVVPLVATGGSRMQEGMLALTQLQRVARQSALTRAAGLAQLAVARDPTTGGGWATLGAGADVTLALPGAQIGFAGSRVRPPDADPAAYTAEAQLAAGSVDAVVAPEELRATLGHWLRLLTRPSGAPAPVPAPLGATDAPGSGREAVRRARAPERPRARAYLDAYFTDRREISGDRCGGADPDGMLCGFGTREDAHGTRTVAYAAQTGTATRPAGFRTAARLIRLADRLGIPVLTLVDTPGAANDAAAERQGVGPAVAELFGAVAAAGTPVTTLLIGEGGSGGALALAAPGRTWATPDSYFSVIGPEAATAILKRPPERADETAGLLRLRPQDLAELGVIRTSEQVFPGTGDRRS
ncbi:carboxyl transferase domain-containing protein [Streptomyces griseoviridis]|jgi:acetyl-CoA carboxylase carboxyl transferase subunit beta|uniref:Acetyl-coenzyme A carboxylase carboxyl transferase subunits beta/alpha n=3 Tax=Streptomyces TaxID=1883 RepID=A0A918G4Y5_STRGD|nr:MULTISPECIES: carboxyl transferase domain-containing protein [Streptomyces]MDP9681605.1 acetyl-CoA carboxylase carboxyl transferase subunit beta [Streptomyces griseoviridis]GGS19757.1 acetyl-CoA carboxylase [Streptomyces niveoruber]GGS73337.1 acetyl-CoA carboxylase [Streptomyces griseoviridis]GGU43636.1 acetyl-CoA carboxylase [Streptomyces daghestanicus]GHI34398.1 acetyl-CoA carboxylase [Streptomyces daghestanicus]